MKTKIEKAQEQSVRGKAKRLGYRLTKSRTNLSLDNLGEYMLVNATHNGIVLGDRFDASLDQIQNYLNAEAGK